MTIEHRMTPAQAREHVALWDWPYFPPRSSNGFPDDLIAKRKELMERARQETGWVVSPVRYEWAGAKLEFRVSGHYASTRGTVRLDAGEWPPDADLIALADGCHPVGHNDHFGGNVSPIVPGENTRKVAVYTD